MRDAEDDPEPLPEPGAAKVKRAAKEGELDEIDLEFEKAMSDEVGAALFHDEEIPDVGATGTASAAWSANDEAALTRALKHERLEHYEETRAIFTKLLARSPGNATVARHLERVNRILLRETPKARKIRHLSNWLDRVKGAYHVS